MLECSPSHPHAPNPLPSLPEIASSSHETEYPRSKPLSFCLPALSFVPKEAESMFLFSLVVDSQKLTSLLSFSRSSAPFSPGNASTFGSCLLTVAPASSFVVTTLTWATAAPPEALQVCRRCCPLVQHYLPSSFCTSFCADANPANPTALGRQSVPGYETEDQGGHG